jgi:cation diffusion facilitator family transporter
MMPGAPLDSREHSCGGFAWPGLARTARQLHLHDRVLDGLKSSGLASCIPGRTSKEVWRWEIDSIMAGSKKAIYAAIAADTGIAVSKFVAAGFSGSSSMFAEGIHSVIDAGIVALLLVGISRSQKPPDLRHPFGHSRELYYWSNVVALMLFSLGGGMSLLEGFNRLIHPRGPESPYWSYGVLAVAAILGAYSLSVAYRQLRQSQPGKRLYEAIRASKDPRNISVFLVDTADLIGVALAFASIIGARFSIPHTPTLLPPS